MISRGDIRWFRFSAPDKRRPVLVLGNASVLGSLSEIPVVPLSTQIRGLPWEVQLDVNDGLPGPCALKPEWIKAVDRALIGPWIATLHEEKWNAVRHTRFCWYWVLTSQLTRLVEHRGPRAFGIDGATCAAR